MKNSFGWEGKDRYGLFHSGYTRGWQIKLRDPSKTRAIYPREEALGIYQVSSKYDSAVAMWVSGLRCELHEYA